ncbi:hypothetical protein MRB53_040738 [Persea americana]|nr:hypothetical protein MRB53_040738 [Persea americana]
MLYTVCVAAASCCASSSGEGGGTAMQMLDGRSLGQALQGWKSGARATSCICQARLPRYVFIVEDILDFTYSLHHSLFFLDISTIG